MRKAIVVSMILAIAGSAIAADPNTSAKAPTKETVTYPYDPPQVVLQGGDTILDATAIPGVPYNNFGTTAGYVNDYDEACPYTGSTSPDVVYSFTPSIDMAITVDLCGSAYDTKIYIYDDGLDLIACNDDFYFDDVCGVYVSKIESADLLGGQPYYIVVDGYGGDYGDYQIEVTEYIECFVTCDPDAAPENEPPLGPGYQDAYNGGCNSPEFGNPFQSIYWANTYEGEAWLCGRSGWFLGSDGWSYRDTDWFEAIAAGPFMVFTVESKYPCNIYKLNGDCPNVVIEHEATADCGKPASLVFGTFPGEIIWLWVGPSSFNSPDGEPDEFTYFATLYGHVWYPPLPTDEISWGGIKALYR